MSEKLQESKEKVIDLGWANGWKEIPDLIKTCNKKKHPIKRYNIGRCQHEYRCDFCGYVYKADSGD